MPALEASMWLLLNPRFLIALAVVGLLSFSHFWVYRHGKAIVRAEWVTSVAAANQEARALEQRRQDRVNEAAVLATKRASVIAADAARAGDAVSRLRDALNTRQLAEESIAAAVKRANTAEQLLVESGEAYRELAQKADRHVSDIRQLQEAWPVK